MSTETYQIVRAQFGGDLFGEIARVLSWASLAKTHRSVGRHIATAPHRGAARHDARQVDARGPIAFGRERAAYRMPARPHVGE